MKKLSVLLCCMLLVGCVTPIFEIVPNTDKFTDPNAPKSFVGKNNRLSTKSSDGIVSHIDDKGVYLDPFVYKSRKDDHIVSLGFFIDHYNFELEEGFRPINTIVFLTDKNERIELNPKYNDSEFNVGNWNSISRKYNTSYWESYTADISITNFTKLANAQFVDVKISGGKLSQVYSRDEISPVFLENLKQFLNEQLSK